MYSLLVNASPLVLGLGFSYVSVALIARIFGPEVFGTYLFALTLISLAATLSKAGHEWVILKIIPEFKLKNETRKIRWVLEIVFGSVLKNSLVAAVILVVIMFVFLRDTYVYFVVPSAFLVIFLALGELRRSWALAYGAVWLSDAPENVVKSVIMVFVSWFWLRNIDSDVSLALIWLNLITTVLTAFFATALFIFLKEPSFFLKPREETDLSIHSGLVGSMWLSTLSNVVLRSADILVVGMVSNAETTGIYAAASRFALLSASPVMVLDRIVAPKIAVAASEKDKVAFSALARNYVLLSSVGAIGALLICAIWGEEIIMLIYGAAYIDSLNYVLIFLVGNLALAFSGPSGIALSIAGGHKRNAEISILSAAINIVLLIVLTPLFGALGAVIATVASLTIKSILAAVSAFQLTNVRTSILGLGWVK